MDELQSTDPRQIGPYWLEGRLGSGGMGRVYLGRSPGGRHVAVKVIRADLAENPDFRARFAREASAARKVSGIFTAPVVDVDLDGPVPWLATSYIAGPSLADAVAERGPMPSALVLRLAAGLAEGLAAIHSAGVVHRDLKPANVLLPRDGPRLIDFGISRSMEGSTLTQTGIVVGSPGFMSPEQAQGRSVGPPSDIFSLGAVLTFAATGEGPFGEGSTVALLYRVVTGQPNTHGVPAEIRPLIEHCLVKDPRQRPTAAQLLTQLSTAEVGATGVAGTAGAAAGQAYPATQRPAVPPALQGDGSDWRPTLSPSEAQRAYYEHVTEGERPGSGPVPEAERDRSGLVPGAERYRGRPARGSPRHRSSRRGWLVAVAAIVVLAAVGAVTFLTGKAGPHSSSPGTVNAAASSAEASASAGTSAASGSPSATQLPGAAAMTAIGSDLAQSAAVRPTVQAAINNVQNCSESPNSGEAALQQAISTRQNILQGLATLDVSGLPNGAQLVSTLTAAMQNSLSADKDYHAWMADLVNGGSACGSNASQDSNYAAGGTASSAATTSKDDFLATWNPMAPRYGQQTYSDTGF